MQAQFTFRQEAIVWWSKSMDASLRWHDEDEAEVANRRHSSAGWNPFFTGGAGKGVGASLRPLLRICALAALVHPEHRCHNEEMTKGCFYLHRIRDALRILFPEIRDEP